MAQFAIAAAMTAASVAQQQMQAKRQAKQIEVQRRQQVGAIQEQQSIENRRRREELRKAQATQRARFAGSGISADSGSASSLLSGLARQVDEAIVDQNALNQLRIDDINANARTQRKSVLGQAQSAMFGGGMNIMNMGMGEKGLNLFGESAAKTPAR